EPELPGEHRIDVRREPGEIAAATRAGHVGAGAQHPRALDPPRLYRVAQGNVDERAEGSDVADRREPGEQRVTGVLYPGPPLLGTRAGDQRGVPLTGVLEPDQVAVGIDQTGEQRRAVQADHARPV